MTDPIKIIRDRMEEIIGEEELVEKLRKGKMLHCYWGTAPTSPPSFAYFLPLLKLKELVKCNFIVTILLADVHSYMDKGMGEYDRTMERTMFYELVLKSMLSTIGIEEKSVRFVKGSDYQFDRKFCMDLLRMSAFTTVGVATKASSETVKRGDKDKDCLISHLLYPMMQSLDETYLSADLELGGRDQRKILTFSRDNIQKLGYEKCAYVITPLIPSLRGKNKKMSSSDPNSKLSFMDSDEEISVKIQRAFCVDMDSSMDSNPILGIIRHILFPFFEKLELQLDANARLEYDTYDKLLVDWTKGSLLSQGLKQLAIKYVIQLIGPVRSTIQSNMGMFQDAYGAV
jgi:tyrosyl-tRNA synthetase